MYFLYIFVIQLFLLSYVWDPLFKSNDRTKNNPVYFFEVTNWLSPFQVSFLAIFIILPIWAKWRMIVETGLSLFEILYYFSYLLSLVALNSISWNIIANGDFFLLLLLDSFFNKKKKNCDSRISENLIEFFLRLQSIFSREFTSRWSENENFNKPIFDASCIRELRTYNKSLLRLIVPWGPDARKRTSKRRNLHNRVK